jgi:hypothetical protein
MGYFTYRNVPRIKEIIGVLQSVSDDMDEGVVLGMILNVRNKLLLLGGYKNSIHESPYSVFGILYLPMITNQTLVRETLETSPLPTSSSQFMTTQFKVRKAPDQLGSRSIYNSTKKVLLSAVESFGDEHALFYLESAVEKLKKRKRNEIEEEVEDDYIENSDHEGEEKSHVISLEDEDRVVEAASNFAAKYITYTEQDKTDILNLFKVVLEVARERNMSNYEREAAKTTVYLLKENLYYSKLSHRTISHRTITRWYAGRHKNEKARGPKIDEDLVWGKLMHCVFEKVILIYVLLYFLLCFFYNVLYCVL